MIIRNLTPFSQMVYANEDAQGRLFDILIVKASYTLTDAFDLVMAPEQEPLNFADQCYEDFNTSSLRYPSDLVPYKPRTDVIVIADAHAPDGKPSKGWNVRVQVGSIDQTLQVSGPRQWQPRLSGWKLGDAEPVTHVPMRYELAYGGEHPGPDDTIVTDERNPIGVGFADRRHSPRDVPLPAPQILAADQSLTDPFRKLTPVGIGPVPPAWLPRRPLGGTYDDNWIENIWPHWAPDYDFAFHNSAARGMKSDGFLTGEEVLNLHNLHPDHPDISLPLPADPVIAHFVAQDGTRRMVRANLDTVYVDILDAAPEDCLIALTWRVPFLEDDWAMLEIDHGGNPNPMRELADDRMIYAASHPGALFEKKAA